MADATDLQLFEALMAQFGIPVVPDTDARYAVYWWNTSAFRRGRLR